MTAVAQVRVNQKIENGYENLYWDTSKCQSVEEFYRRTGDEPFELSRFKPGPLVRCPSFYGQKSQTASLAQSFIKVVSPDRNQPAKAVLGFASRELLSPCV